MIIGMIAAWVLAAKTVYRLRMQEHNIYMKCLSYEKILSLTPKKRCKMHRK